MDELVESVSKPNDFWKSLDVLNNNKYFVGLVMILLNVGSKFISMELTYSHEKFLGSRIVRRLILFTVFFTATRDIWVSFLLTAAFVILVTGIFNEDSQYCIIPKKYRHFKYTSDIPKEEINKAKELLKYHDIYKNKKNTTIKDIIQNEFNNKKKTYLMNIEKLNFFKNFKNSKKK